MSTFKSTNGPKNLLLIIELIDCSVRSVHNRNEESLGSSDGDLNFNLLIRLRNETHYGLPYIISTLFVELAIN